MDDALDEFLYIASHTAGRSGSQYKSDAGYEFVIWIEEGDEHPEPEHEAIKWAVNHDDGVFEGYYRFSMTLPYEEA